MCNVFSKYVTYNLFLQGELVFYLIFIQVVSLRSRSLLSKEKDTFQERNKRVSGRNGLHWNVSLQRFIL